MEQTSDKTILIAGYPKSGSVWLTRLLGDILQSSTHAYWHSRDHEDIAAMQRDGEYDIRRGHFNIDYEEKENFLPRPHTFALKAWKQEKAILIIRDPRDIAVSAKFYFNGGNHSLDTIISMMHYGTGHFRHNGSYGGYLMQWQQLLRQRPSQVTFVRYEDMQANCLQAINGLLGKLQIPLPTDEDMQAAIARQSFESKRKRVSKQTGKHSKLNRHHMRKGKAGDWKNHFTASEARLAEKYFGYWLDELDYEENDDWWKEVK